MNHELPEPESLDPDDWEQVRRMGHQMIDEMLDQMQSLRDRPAWQPVPESVKQTLDEPVPWKGASLKDVYQVFRDNILPYPTGNGHPRFFGWVMGNGTPTGALADFLASAMNCHVAGYDQAATLIEDRVLEWMKQLLGYPDNATGLLVSGATMANLNALLVARNEIAGLDIREQGLQAEVPPLAVYGSSETHSWILKACEVMGLGRQAFRRVPVDSRFRIDLDSCRQMIRKDISDGCRPFCVIGNAGTVNSGAIDDLDGLRDLADEFKIWFHIDGAFGSLAAWSPASKHLVDAQSRSDSLAFDLHKWGSMPYEVACVLIRFPQAHKETFGYSPSYLHSTNRGISVDTTRFADRGLQLSRGFRALKVWMSLKEQGVDRIGRVIEQNIQQARFLGRLVTEHEHLDLLAPVSLNIVCLRYVAEGLDNDSLNELNQEILLRIQESGYAIPSQTILGGSFAIRVCITNHRSVEEDFVGLVDAVVRHGHQVLDGWTS